MLIKFVKWGYYMKKFLLLLIFVFLSNSCFAQEIFTYKLENGQTVVIEQVKNNPNDIKVNIRDVFETIPDNVNEKDF